jgi:hypothetical protein
VTVTDPASKLIKVSRGWLQAYNAEAVATKEQVVLLAELTCAVVDFANWTPCWPAIRRTWPALLSTSRSVSCWRMLAIIRQRTPPSNHGGSSDATSKEHKLRSAPSDFADGLREADGKASELVARRPDAHGRSARHEDNRPPGGRACGCASHGPTSYMTSTAPRVLMALSASVRREQENQRANGALCDERTPCVLVSLESKIVPSTASIPRSSSRSSPK